MERVGGEVCSEVRWGGWVGGEVCREVRWRGIGRYIVR